MSLRFKIFLSFSLILALIIFLLSLNTVMAKRENMQMQNLLLIHHRYTALLNLKISVDRQLSEAQEIFLYGKEVDQGDFQQTTDMVKRQVAMLVEAVGTEEETAVEVTSPEHGQEPVPDAERSLPERLVELQHRYEDIHRQLLLLSRLMQVGRKSKAEDHFKGHIRGRFIDFFSYIDQWIEVEKNKLQQTEKDFVAISSVYTKSSVIGLGAILLTVLFFSLTTFYLLGPRLKELLRGTKRISQGDFTHPVPSKGADEFSHLARALNEMMDRLAESRKKLLEQSYYSGMADMVSGILHNVKNSLAPMMIDIEEMERHVNDLGTEKLQAAIQRLSGNDLTDDLRSDLGEYAGLACQRLDEKSQEMAECLRTAKNKMSLITGVLNDHYKYASAERPLEVVRLDELVQESLALVRTDYLDRYQVEIGSGIAEVGAVLTQRIVMVQVLANLLINGLESVDRSGREDGVVLVEAEIRQQKEKRLIAIRVHDNGEGIEEARLQEIFQRGISNKQGSFGLGLHWCANAVASLEGRLFAESEGVGKGACFCLEFRSEVVE